MAVFIGTVAGLGTDLLSGGLLGANGFSMTLTAYLIAALVTRVMLDNPLLRIPVLAGAAAFDTVVYLPPAPTARPAAGHPSGRDNRRDLRLPNHLDDRRGHRHSLRARHLLQRDFAAAPPPLRLPPTHCAPRPDSEKILSFHGR
jgi:hypothetical protein